MPQTSSPTYGWKAGRFTRLRSPKRLRARRPSAIGMDACRCDNSSSRDAHRSLDATDRHRRKLARQTPHGKSRPPPSRGTALDSRQPSLHSNKPGRRHRLNIQNSRTNSPKPQNPQHRHPITSQNSPQQRQNRAQQTNLGNPRNPRTHRNNRKNNQTPNAQPTATSQHISARPTAQ